MKTENEYNEILSMVTHDLKSPMTAVIGCLELLEEDEFLSKDEKKRCIKSAKKASKSIMKLVEDISIMAKSEAGKEHVEYKNISNLKNIMEDVYNTFKYEMKIKSIDFKIDIDKDLPIVYWDIDKIQYHVLNNIISNAIKFTNYGGEITLKITSKDGYVKIKIKDNGIGIPKDKRETIFEKYDTHHNQKVFKGTGLGLYNAYNFISKHNGTISVDNGINGKGTGFVLLIPIEPTKKV